MNSLFDLKNKGEAMMKLLEGPYGPVYVGIAGIFALVSLGYLNQGNTTICFSSGDREFKIEPR